MQATVVDYFLNGRVRFGALTYYVSHEHPAVGDPGEGSLSYSPNGGLRLTINRGGRRAPVPGTLRSSLVGGVYALCTSVEPSPRLAQEFGDTAIGVRDPSEFVRRLDSALFAKGATGQDAIRHGLVSYEDDASLEPYIAWALPEKIGFHKRATNYQWQREYRLAFGPPGAWDVEAVDLDLELRPTLPDGRVKLERYTIRPVSSYSPATPSAGVEWPSPGSHAVVDLGDIRDICSLHKP